ncbi:MAG: chlorophyllase/cutinase-like alpha/beta fold protein [Actinomycetota bacterium]
MRRSVVGVAVVVGLALGGSVGGAGSAGADAAGTYPVGVTERTVVDRSRITAANGECAEIATRTLPTKIFYPASAVPDTPSPEPPAASGDGPFPLIVFAHGYRALPEYYASLLTHWAAAGYVVAAPTFPLSSGRSPCGAIVGDVVEQPADMSAVIDDMLVATKRPGLLKGMVDPRAIGAAGHSNGGITTYGLVANTERHDPRVRAAAILAGTPQRYPTGRYDFRIAPPLLFVHGTDDALVPYAGAENGFNAARGPKALLTLEGGNHGSPAGAVAYAATTDFFDAYLRGDAVAKARLPQDQTEGASRMVFVAKPGARTTVSTLPRVVRDLKATVTPAKNLTDGQQVTVAWSGYTPGKAVSILQCNGSNRDLSNSTACDFAKAKILQPNPTGEGSVTMTVIAGPVGNGTCDAKHPGCFIVVVNESSADPANSVLVDLAFAK